jgi:hypothetical protein
MTDARVATASVSVLSERPSDDARLSAATQSGVDAYLASAERMRGVADWTMKAGIVLVLLVLVAWALGVLPGAVRLF